MNVACKLGEDVAQGGQILLTEAARADNEFTQEERARIIDVMKQIIANDAVDIVQPDLYYFGGLIRSMRVARMAHALALGGSPPGNEGHLGYVRNVRGRPGRHGVATGTGKAALVAMEADGAVRIGFGECTGRVVAAPSAG